MAQFTTPLPIDLVTGTGAWKPFVRIQNTDPHSHTDCSPSSKQTCEQGYNTSDPLQFDEKSGIWTHDLLFSAAPIVTLNNVKYLEFALDIAEPDADNANQSKSLLSLDQLQLFVSASDIDTTNAYPQLRAMGR